MIYLFETEHFLLREKRPGDICRCPEFFPGSGVVLPALQQNFGRNKNMPEVLIIESRITGAPSGEVLIKNAGDSAGKAEIRCFLYGKFQKDKFEKEIIDMLSQKAVKLPPPQPEAPAQYSPAAYRAPFPRPVPKDKEHG